MNIYLVKLMFKKHNNSKFLIIELIINLYMIQYII